MVFWRIFSLLILFALYSFGIRLEILIGFAAFLAVFLPNFWEILLFGVFVDALGAEFFGAATVSFSLTVLFAEFLKGFFKSSDFLARLLPVFLAAAFFYLVFFGRRFLFGLPLDFFNIMFSALLGILGAGIISALYVFLDFFLFRREAGGVIK